ncbi:MAG: exonuclease domain-containing protein [Polaribacter sp.]|uniref:exonuclease domain-containing protein n=1 Tax=Polaribacter sp. TaxID=1920175 RepID=UPI002604457C|nr:exonuclease domain-containing protein [Polaribacter sp.]MBT3740670.1 DNA polymerase III subunit epsilon [Polaribacter sp.]MDG1195924.1 exonuclease domain-containing protein [Polaribacter sp.]MDG1403271.1 exonuclease domain-containing protein [Polaribacter sp.]
MYAILDIETTGGKFNEEGITEIAIYKFDGHDIVDQFISLVNPEKPIQEFVVQLTGINNKMLKNAPKFFEAAKRIIEITSDCILVAHNTTFDYRILSTEFNRLGYDFNRNTLCTVELSQKLILNQPSYSLGKLTKSLGIPMTDRHRASGDALATVQLFKLLLEKDVNKAIIQKSIKYFDRRLQKQKLKTLIEETPTIQGLFYIHDINGKVIYLGRGKNIKAEVNKLFLKVTTRAVKIQERVETISFDKTGNDLFTNLKYEIELEVLSPKFNFKKKHKKINKDFNNEDFIIVEKGREVEEHAIILVERNEVLGYGYTNLKFQENRLDILKSILTPIANKIKAKNIIKNYINKNKVQKIIRL